MDSQGSASYFRTYIIHVTDRTSHRHNKNTCPMLPVPVILLQLVSCCKATDCKDVTGIGGTTLNGYLKEMQNEICNAILCYVTYKYDRYSNAM